MKVIDLLGRDLRHAWRTLGVEREALKHRLLPDSGPIRPIPARLELDMDRGWRGAPADSSLPTEFWLDVVLQAVKWLGPVSVTLLIRGTRLHPDAPRVLRYAHRLGCPVRIFGQGEGIRGDMAGRLVDAGLGSATILFGGVSEGVYAEIIGGNLPIAAEVMLSLIQARDQRRSRTEVVVDFPCLPVSAGEILGVAGWARQVGADGFQANPSLYAPLTPSIMDERTGRVLDGLSLEPGSFHRTRRGTREVVAAIWTAGDGEPGAHRLRGSCPVGFLRLGVRADGHFGACPFKVAMGSLRDGRSLRESWEVGTEHMEVVRACRRVCHHPELTRALRSPR